MALILLAEDNRVTAEIMRTRLETAGHEVVRAADGREALDELARLRPQLILLDMMMPEIDGAELLRRVKGDAVLASIPVLVVSARSNEEDILSALAAGADDYVTKPISLRELLARVERVLAQARPPLRMTVQGESGPVCVGELSGADPGGAVLRFHRDSAPRFAIGDPARLSLSSPSLPQPIELSARVRSRTEAEPHRLYGFRLQRRGKRAAEMTKAFLDLVGNRCDLRVRVDPPLEIRVLVQSERESHEFSGVADDLSLGGARLLLPTEAERRLSRVERVELRVWLPGDEQPLTLAVDLRHRSASGDGVAYGTRFDPEASPDFPEQQQRIGDFVAGLRRS